MSEVPLYRRLNYPVFSPLAYECGKSPSGKQFNDPFQFKNNHFTEMCFGSEAGSYLRLTDSCITQLKAQGPPRTCNESKEEENAF